MPSITVPLPQNSYEISVAPGNLDRLGPELARLDSGKSLGKKMLLVSNPTVFQHYGERAIASLRSAEFDVAHHLIPDGEQYKTLDSIQSIYDAAFQHRLERSSTLVSLGGGVIGDMTGFAAATWLRGIHFVQVPTSLLAMVDASVGGKTGVNHPQGKNLIGAFYQPRWVCIDPDVLATLPPREFRAGMAEVVKYGVIWDAPLFERLEAEERLDELACLSPELLQEILLRSCQCKAEVVGKDEKEAGLRAILNYGHTVAHAVEALAGYGTVLHGEAVAIGMVAAGHLAIGLSAWDAECQERQQVLLDKIGLPTRLPAGLAADASIEAMKSDKKVKNGKVRFVLPLALGSAGLSDRVTEENVRSVLQRMAA